MALVKRHWKEILVTALLSSVALVWGILSNGESQGAPGEEAETLTAPDYSAIAAIREKLHLTDVDLAAMGCSEETARGVLTALRSWYVSKKADLAQSESNRRSKARSLRAAIKRINIGPRDEGLLAQVPSLKQALDGAERGQNDLIMTVVSDVQASLSWSERAVWETVRSNGKSAGDYRYAPGLTAEQTGQLKLAVRQVSRERIKASTTEERLQVVGQFRAREREILSSAQENALTEAKGNVRQHLAGVRKASLEVLPVPEELVPKPPMEEQPWADAVH